MPKFMLPLKYTRSQSVMFLLGCFLFALIIGAGSVLAETWYIKPSSEIPLRRGQGTDYRILAILPDGEAVTILEEGDSWAKVITQEKKEGWILKRYLTLDPPLQELVDKLQQENGALKEEIADLLAKNEEYSTFNGALKNSLEKNKTELASLTDSYQRLKNDTADVQAIKTSLDQNRQTVTKLQQELGSVTAENKRLKASQNIKWFLAGGGTLIFGCIVGMISAKSRKRKPSLY